MLQQSWYTHQLVLHLSQISFSTYAGETQLLLCCFEGLLQDPLSTGFRRRISPPLHAQYLAWSSKHVCHQLTLQAREI